MEKLGASQAQLVKEQKSKKTCEYFAGETYINNLNLRKFKTILNYKFLFLNSDYFILILDNMK